MSTSTTTTLRPTHTDALVALRIQVEGRVSTSTDPDWDQVRAAWNLHVDQQPAAVVHAANADDVAATVRFARDHGYSVAVQPSGHGATGTADGTILLRTRRLGGIEIDVDARVARVGAGVKVREVQAALVGTGLSLLAGSNGDPSVVGYTLGGGLSWFGRRYGLAANHVRAPDVVRPDGQPARVTAESDPDLFWALRGGGGDCAVVTALEIGLVEAPHIYGGRLMWPQERAEEVLRTFAGIAGTAPEELTLWAWLLNFPSVDEIPQPMRGKSFVAVDFTYLGLTDAAEDLVAPLRALGTPGLDTTGIIPVDQIGAVAMEPDDPTPAVEGSALLHTFDEHTIWSLLAVAGRETRSPLLGVQIRHLGGALARPAENPGVQGVVDGEFLVFYVGIPMAPGIEAKVHERMALLDTALAPFSTGRRFFNFTPGADPSSAIGAEQLARLREIKRRRDPLGVIRSNRPVLPSTAGKGLVSVG